MTNFFLSYLLAPIILIVGHVGNIFGLIVIGRKKLDKIGPVLIYKFLFIMDSIYLSIFIINLTNINFPFFTRFIRSNCS
jgi:hypothetical protein